MVRALTSGPRPTPPQSKSASGKAAAPLTPYEKARARNIEVNASRMKSLGVTAAAKAISKDVEEAQSTLPRRAPARARP